MPELVVRHVIQMAVAPPMTLYFRLMHNQTNGSNTLPLVEGKLILGFHGLAHHVLKATEDTTRLTQWSDRPIGPLLKRRTLPKSQASSGRSWHGRQL